MKLDIVDTEKFYDIKIGQTTAFDKSDKGFVSIFNGKLNFLLPPGDEKYNAIILRRDVDGAVGEIDSLDDVYIPLLLGLATQEALLDKGDSISVQKASVYTQIISGHIELIAARSIRNERTR